MRIVIATLKGIVIALAVQTASAQYDGGTSIFEVDPSKVRPSSQIERLDRTRPYLSIYAVDAPVRDCPEDRCWPTASFFVLNTNHKIGQDITVRCSALSRSGKVVGEASETPRLFASEVGYSLVVFEGADFSQFAKVECRLVGVIPNDLKRR